MKFLLSTLSVISSFVGIAQFAPAAGQPGSTAVYKDSSVFAGWATQCFVQRGLRDLSQPDSGLATFGDESSAIGKAGENGVVSLGDGGFTTLQFAWPVTNGNGFDFAVFENSFLDNYLEFAFVEVSSDGVNYVRFPATAVTQDTLQVGPFDFVEPTTVNNLAGKYRALYGTPFDLEELADSSIVDVNHITHIRLVDVVGSINPFYATYDYWGNKVNDPWPTPFESSGFDLDAVGIVHFLVNVQEDESTHFQPIPNPASSFFRIMGGSEQEYFLMDACGRVLMPHLPTGTSVNTSALAAGVYTITDSLFQKPQKLLIAR